MRNGYLAFLTVVILFCVGSSKISARASAEQSKLFAQQKGPLVFVENRGQIVDEKGLARPDILFTLRHGNTSVFLTSTSIHYQFEKVEYPEGYVQDLRTVENVEKQEALRKQVKRSTHRMTLSLKGANSSARAIKEDPQAYTENYYFPQYPDGITGLRSYARITFKDVYPGIDWIVYSNAEDGSGITYDFIVHPGADPNKIRLEIKDADEVVISESGELLMKNQLGIVTENAPVSFCGTTVVGTRFVQTKDGIGFGLDDYDKQLELRIDPRVIWATYYGGPGGERLFGLTTDDSGNVYLAGITASTSGVAASGFQMSYGGGNSDAMLVKLNAAGNRLWATYYGAYNIEEGWDCAVDHSGNVYMAGVAYSQGLGTIGVFQRFLSGVNDGFLAKFNANGTRQWFTYFGGLNTEKAYSCAVDLSGNVYLAGDTWSPNLGYNGYKNTYTSTAANYPDVYLAKFDPSGNRIWASYYGGANFESNGRCVTDDFGNVYLYGSTQSDTGIATAGAFSNTLGTSPSYIPQDAFLVKFNGGGARLWATYYGGPFPDYGRGCATDASGNVYLTGPTYSTTGIATSGSFQSTFVSHQYANSYLVKFTGSGQRLWGTYFSGDASTQSMGCSTDAIGNVFISGQTQSRSGLAWNGVQNAFGGGNTDVFIAKFDSAGKRNWASFYGGAYDDEVGVCATDNSGNVFLAGNTYSGSGIAQNGFQNYMNGPEDAFVVKIGDTVAITTDSLRQMVYCAGDTLRVPFHSYGIFNPGNVFTAQLSDGSGSFITLQSIGSKTSAKNIDTIMAVIPFSTPGGIQYRIRVVSSMPQAIGRDNRVDITINTVPAQPGTIIGDDSACTGATRIYRVAPVAGAVNYVWALPPSWSGSSNADTIVAIAGASGGTISVVAVNACGTSLPRTRTVVSGNFFVTPTVFIPHGIKCKGKANVFHANSTYAGTNPVFQWKKNGVNVGSNSSTYFDTALVSGDVIRVEMTSNAECISQAKVVSNNDTVVVGTPTVPGININSYPPIVLCDGTPIRFVSNIVTGGTSPTYQWYKNGALIPGATASTYTDSLLVNSDTMTVALYSSDDCPVTQPTISNHVGVTVYPNLPTAVNIAASPDSIANGAPITFTATPVNGGPRPSYVWYLNTIPIPFDTTDTWTAFGLKNGDVVSVRMESSEQCPVPVNAWSTPLMMHSYTTSVTMIANNAGVKIYPNPVSNYLIVELDKSINDGLLALSDALGRTVFSAPVNGTKCSYDLSNLATGVYVYRVRMGNEELSFGKIVKQ